jgi:hypothetical protein
MPEQTPQAPAGGGPRMGPPQRGGRMPEQTPQAPAGGGPRMGPPQRGGCMPEQTPQAPAGGGPMLGPPQHPGRQTFLPQRMRRLHLHRRSVPDNAKH